MATKRRFKSADSYETSELLETQGVWLDFEGFSIKVARAGGANKAFEKAYNAKMKPLLTLSRGNLMNIPTDRQHKVNMECWAEHVVLDWTVVEILEDDGSLEIEQDVPCTYENVVEFFEEYPEVFNEVVSYSGNYRNFLQSLVDAVVGNSKRS